MSTYKRCYFIFVTGAIGYCTLEILWRGYTHPSMGIAGGLCLIGIYYISRLNFARFLVSTSYYCNRADIRNFSQPFASS